MFRKIRLYSNIYFSVKVKTLQQRMINKYDFFIYIFCDLILQTTNIVFFYALFQNIPALQGWDYHQVLLIYGLVQLAYGLFGFLFWPLYDFGYVLVSGAFDGVLMKPLNSLFQQLIKGLGDIGGLFLGAGLVIYSFIQNDISLTIPNLIVILGTLLFSLILLICFYTLIASISFWMENTTGILMDIFNLCGNFAKYPLNIYHKSIKNLFTWILPLGFIGFYPASYFLDNAWSRQMIYLPVISLVLVLITVWVWNRGIQHYKGAGN